MGLTTVVTGEDNNCIILNSLLGQFLHDQDNPVVDAFEHGSQVRIVIAGPMIQGISLVSRILAEVALFTVAFSRRMLTTILFNQLFLAV